MQIEIKVLEYNSGFYKEQPYSNVLARYNGRIIKFKIKSNSSVSLSEKDVDKFVTVELEIVAGQNQSAVPRIVAVVS